MSDYLIIYLKEGKEASITYKHPWIFSGALGNKTADISHGSLVWLAGHDGNILATGSYSACTTIAVRIFEFSRTEINREWMQSRISASHKRRLAIGYAPQTETTGYRVVFGESDGIPGLIIDRYNDVFVIQLSTAGIVGLKNLIVDSLVELFKPKAIVERSDLPVRQEEKLDEVKEIIYGDAPGVVEFRENGLRYLADVMQGQKTGFYLDQKELRAEVLQLAKGLKVLNLFSYTGATGIAAIKGGALSVLNVDSSEQAQLLSDKIRKLNDIAPESYGVKSADIFNWLAAQHRPEYDMVILDPPALIKSRNDKESGQKAYHFINRAALRLINDGGIIVSSSCSAFFSESDFSLTLRRASVQANVTLEYLNSVKQSPDHPISLYFPESYYLKSFVCRVRR